LPRLTRPAYDIGVLSDRGMLPGLSNLSAENVLSRLSLLKAHNARGAHIYIRPAGEHRFSVLDDLRFGFLLPCSPATALSRAPWSRPSLGNFQAWLKHDDVYPAPLATFHCTDPCQAVRRDPSAADWRRFGRLPGFTNCKPKIPQGQRPLSLRFAAAKANRSGDFRQAAVRCDWK